ncbi:MAG: hypothetical protein Q8K70_00070 [Bacteroidota bacterium]|nr:hypothetical protein [Bacteroidota bacterium]
MQNHLKYPQFSPSVPQACGSSTWDKVYRYGFNSMEKDNEINVNGGDYDFGARIYDSRLGRWLSLDPLWYLFKNSSPYSNSFNTPISIIDKGGMYPSPPLHYQFFSEIAPLIYTAAKAKGASVEGALLIIAQAANESFYGISNKTKTGNDYNLFGIMRNNSSQPSKRGTGHGALLDFSELGGYAGCVDYYFNVKLQKQWPLILDIIKQESFTSDDLNKGFYTFNYYEEPKKRNLSGHNSYHGSDKDGTAKNIDYGKNVLNGIKTTRRLWIQAIDYDINNLKNDNKSINNEINLRLDFITQIQTLKKTNINVLNELVYNDLINRMNKEIDGLKQKIEENNNQITSKENLKNEIKKD